MPRGVFEKTKEHLEQLKKQGFQKGHHPKTEFKKGHIPWMKGKHHTKKAKKKMSKNHKRFIPWNKDKKLPQWSGENSSGWKGGKKIDSNGYVLIYKPKHPFAHNRHYVFEHHLVIEKQIGRYLKPTEVGHHLGKKNDNRPHMLMAFINHSAHLRFEKNGIIKPEEIVFDGRKI